MSSSFTVRTDNIIAVVQNGKIMEFIIGDGDSIYCVFPSEEEAAATALDLRSIQVNQVIQVHDLKEVKHVQ